MTEDTVECLSVEGSPDPSTPTSRGQWVKRYLTKYLPFATELSDEFIRSNLIFEFAPERAFAVIEREDEFSNRATRWTFAPPG